MTDEKTTMEKYKEALDQAHKNYGKDYYIRKVMSLKEQLFQEQKQADREKEAGE